MKIIIKPKQSPAASAPAKSLTVKPPNTAKPFETKGNPLTLGQIRFAIQHLPDSTNVEIANFGSEVMRHVKCISWSPSARSLRLSV